MAVIPPLPENGCVGTDPVSLLPESQLKCLKGLDGQGRPVYTCATWRKFKVSCSSINQQCSALSDAWVAAITVCNQRLF